MEDRQIFDRQIEVAYQRLHGLVEHGRGSPEQQGVIGEALKALSISLEVLHAAGKEMRRKNEELAVARQLVEAERQRYQDLFEFAPDGYLLTDAKGTIREANRAAAELLRAPQAVLIGRPLANYVVRGERAAFQSQLALLAEAKRTADWQVHLKPRGAQPFPASITVAAARNVQGEATGLRWQVRDITRRKQGQSRRETLLEALRHARDELETRGQERTAELQAEVAEREAAQATLKQERDFTAAVLDTVGALVVVLDRDGRIVRFNRACQQTTGYTFEEVEGRCCWDFLLSPEEVEPVRTTFDNLQGGRFPNEFENSWVARDGSRRLIAWTNTAIPGPDGQVEYIIGTGLDVTDQRQAQSQRVAALEALRCRERDFSTLVENAPDMIVRFDAGLRHTYCNPAVERQLGVPVQTFLGKTSLEAGGQREQAQFVDRSLRKVLETGQELQVEQSYPTPSGVKSFHTRIVPEFDPDGHIESLLAITRDITGRVQAEAQRAAALSQREAALEALRRSMEQLKATQTQLIQAAKLAAVGELAAGVAHELNNPLTSVLGFAELLLNTLPLDNPIRHDLEIIARQARRTRDIVRNLLDFARQTKPQRLPADVNQLLCQTLDLVRQHMENSGVVIEEDYTPDLGPLTLDAGQMKQVFLNLITNASHAMPKGGKLRLRTARLGDEVAVAISDTGEGMSPEVREHIFEPFFTTKPVGEGAGLGLSISLGIVQKHGGRIAVESLPGQGSTFTVWLPIECVDTDRGLA